MGIKEMKIGRRIKQRRKELNLSADELANKIGKDRATVYRYESDQIENLPIMVIEPLAKALKTTSAYLMGWTDDTNENNQIYKNILPISTHRIPLLGKIACGKPIYADEDRESYVEAGTSIKADFCLQAQGDSMINARIHSGDIVFIRAQEMVDNGEIAAVIIEDEVTLKRVYYYPNKSKLILQAENPAYEPLVYVNEELDTIRILGKAIAFQSDVK